MQTFLPYPSYTRSAEVLDDRRLGKQVVECRQIGRAITGQSSGWTRHPAVVMWDGHLGSLLLYARAMAEEWSWRRGTPDRWHKAWVNTLLDHERYIRSRPGGWLDPPPWLGDLRLHWSHQAALHRKEPGKYPAEWAVHVAVHGDYFWPSKHSDYRKS